VRWHRQGFRRYWAWKSRRRCGRPAIETELRDLIRRMSHANPLWGASRIHGELQKLGLTVSQATVSKYMLRPRRPPSQACARILEASRQGSDRVGFLHGTHGDLSGPVRTRVAEARPAPAGAFQCHRASETPRYLIRDRDQIYGERFSRQARLLDIREAVIAPRSPWQNAYAERVIGSIRRECLDHVVVIGERHLTRILSEYVEYYNGIRTHISLAKDAPEPRRVQPRSEGRVVEVSRVGGLHHEYARRAA
jgi:transposase InsO family protein